MTSGPTTSLGTGRELVVRGLHRERPRSTFVRVSLAALAIIAAQAWATGDFRLDDILSERRLDNVARFARELRPFPLQSQQWDWGIAWQWTARLLADKGWGAAVTTLAMSIAAICLAGLAGFGLSFAAARSLTAAEPYLPGPAAPSWLRRAPWIALVAATRVLLIFVRAVPEYVWAFLLVAIAGPTLWAAVLALAIHNTGILGKLNAEVIENLEREAPSALRALGAGRRQIALAGVIPLVVPRFLLFFFYRWETCLREATVLGMLGVASLGFFIQDARARQHYDVMLALILVGSALVLIGDLLSAAAREAVRRSS
jgi:phosphonate transport system permease protein